MISGIPYATAAFLFVIACGVPRSAHSQDINSDSIVQACGAADTTAAWARTARQFSNANVKATNPALRARLLKLDSLDQEVRLVPGLMDSLQKPAFLARMMARDSADAKALMEIVARWGWPGRSLVGSDGARAAFLIAQHNDAIREQALELMLAMPKGEVDPGQLATLQDRVLVKKGKPQKYGTQLHQANGENVMKFDPIENFADLDRRRAEAGLMPLSQYICVIRGIYGRDVVDPSRN